MKKLNLYKITSVAGFLIRTNFLVNAFDSYFDNNLMAILINNAIGEFILWKTTYYISVGSIYEKYSCPAWGSFLYTIFYILNNFIMTGACCVCKWLNIGWGWIFVLYFIMLMAYAYFVSSVRRKIIDESF